MKAVPEPCMYRWAGWVYPVLSASGRRIGFLVLGGGILAHIAATDAFFPLE